MIKIIMKAMLLTAAGAILFSGGCVGYKKTDFAADAAFVHNNDNFNIALYRSV